MENKVAWGLRRENFRSHPASRVVKILCERRRFCSSRRMILEISFQASLKPDDRHQKLSVRHQRISNLFMYESAVAWNFRSSQFSPFNYPQLKVISTLEQLVRLFECSIAREVRDEKSSENIVDSIKVFSTEMFSSLSGNIHGCCDGALLVSRLINAVKNEKILSL
jgi:hypothetical protein